jgi:voltage-gated potassium channel Kch
MEGGNVDLNSPWKRRAWFTLWMIGGASFILADVAFCIAEHNDNRLRLDTFLETLYSSAQLLLFHMPQRELPVFGPARLFLVARCLAVAFAAIGVLLSLLTFNRFLRRWWIVTKGNHTVVFGLSGSGLELPYAQHLGGGVVVIDPGSDPTASIRAEELGASILPGSPGKEQMLRKARVRRAKYLLAATADDYANVAAVIRAREFAPKGQARAFVHIADPQLRALLRRQRSFRSDGPTPATVFNVFEDSARLLLRDHPLDHVRIRPETEQVVQLVVLGFGLMGEAVLTRAALIGHYANLKPIRAIIIDRKANRKEKFFRQRYPHFTNVADARFKEWDVEELETVTQIAALCGDTAQTISTIVIAFGDPPRGLSTASSLRDVLGTSVPIRHRLNDGSGFAEFLPLNRIREAGYVPDGRKSGVWPGSELDMIASTLHVNYLAKLPAAERSSPENRSAYPWDCLDDDLIDSNRQAADHIPVKLRAVGCHSTTRANQKDLGELVDHFEKDEIELLAKLEHRRWMAERFMAGWSLGPKDVAKRLSPYLVEWEALPPDIQEYDRNFVRIIPGLLKQVGQEIRR